MNSLNSLNVSQYEQYQDTDSGAPELNANCFWSLTAFLNILYENSLFSMNFSFDSLCEVE